MDKCGIYLGCNIPFKAPDIEQSFNKVFPQLGVELVSMDGATCCPAWGTAPSFDIDTWLSISGRNITIAEEKGVDIMTGCNSCFGVMAEARHFALHDPARLKKLNENLALIDRKFQGTSEVYHVSHVLHNKVGLDKIKENLKFTLKELKVAVQPGCHILWPTEVMEVKEKNSFYPTMLKDLCEVLEADVPHYSALNACCGMGAMRSTDAEKSIGLMKTKLMSMKEEIDPDMIVTTCSSCYLQFDGSQKILKEKGEIDFEIPVFYYTQLLALCMGFAPQQVAAISETPREQIIAKIQSEARRLIKEEA
ncbi:MAG TPA: CoB--CoM heterodisulfide reductase iron-sulfur subunit B family protein [Desulfopila sp.]|nr:CoB--CoM heterodisulfide reductase iron-sulfur subunit B family protein [Desulfopila sp.]